MKTPITNSSMLEKLVFVLLIIVCVMTAPYSALAEANRVCINSTTGKVLVKKRCSRQETTASASNFSSLIGTQTQIDSLNTELSTLAQGFSTMYFARVDTTGTLLAGSTGVSSSNVSTGTYNVTFGTDVSQCQFLTSPAAKANEGYALSLHVTPRPKFETTNTVEIFVWKSYSSPINYNAGFLLVVLC